MSKGSRIQRVVDYFRESSIDEARVVFQLVREVMDERFKAQPKPQVVRKRRNKKTQPADAGPVVAEQAVGA